MSEIIVVVEWQFSPADYFEAPITISRFDYTMLIDNGKVEAKIDSAIYDAYPSMRTVLHEGLNDRFLSVQLLSHKPYALSEPNIARVYPDGRRDAVAETKGEQITSAAGTVDLKTSDKDGNVVKDSKRDQIDKKKSITELVSKYRTNDELLDSLLNSYGAGVRDPARELVHLYEIRDALSTKFGGEDATQATLTIRPSAWSRFGRLCNKEPLSQGRHRGRNIAMLRDATEGELAEARSFARAMVEAYLQHLERSLNEKPIA
jgi:hypothetical protein